MHHTQSTVMSAAVSQLAFMLYSQLIDALTTPFGSKKASFFIKGHSKLAVHCDKMHFFTTLFEQTDLISSLSK